MSKLKKSRIAEIFVLFIMLLLLAEEFFISKKILDMTDATTGELINMTISRTLGGLAFLILGISCGFKVFNVFKVRSAKSIVLVIPAIIVALNNIPFLSILEGEAKITGNIWQLLFLFAECLAVGFFEEMTFRSFVMLTVMEKRRSTRKQIFVSIIITSAIFGLVHLINMFTSSPVAVLLQICYSFLIGAMCAVVLLICGNVWICVLIHGLFNFMGAIVPTYGEGKLIWDHIPTMIITAVVGVIVAVFYVVVFTKYDPENTDILYGTDRGRIKEAT